MKLFSKLHNKFRSLIAYLIFERNWLWLALLISTLCDLEMNWNLITDPEFYWHLQGASTRRLYPETDGCAPMEKIIPHNTLYCSGCEYRDRSSIADFFYGHQSSGYCYFLGNGDYRFNRPTDLLWDGCKECGFYEDISNEELD